MPESPRGLVKTKIVRLISRVSDLVGLEWGNKTSPFEQLPRWFWCYWSKDHILGTNDPKEGWKREVKFILGSQICVRNVNYYSDAFWSQNVFLNLTQGSKKQSPVLDRIILLSILGNLIVSDYKNKWVTGDTAFGRDSRFIMKREENRLAESKKAKSETRTSRHMELKYLNAYFHLMKG